MKTIKYPLNKNNILREDLNRVIRHLKKNDPKLTNGEYVKKFENEWSKWLGVKYSVFVNSGSSANLLSMQILKILNPNGGNIIVPPLTWVSDISSVIQSGFKPKFADIDLSTLSMNSEKIIKAIDNKTVAVFLSHIQGFNGLSKKLLDYLKFKKILLIEDVCESHGAHFKNKKLGTYGLMSNFSFYYAHHMSTIEGGMVCTNNSDVYQNLRMLRAHGMTRELTDVKLKSRYEKNFSNLNPKFIFAFPSFNMRNNEIGGIIGLNQLKRLDKNILKRNYNHRLFLSELNEKIFYTDFELTGSSNYAFNLILLKKNKSLFEKICNALTKNGIEFRRGSAGGGNQLRQPYLNRLFSKRFAIKFVNTEHIHFFGLYIGNFPDLKKNDIKMITKIINKATNE
ncbi:MAG: CDP-4-keto-6-deoxy-D-glucose-3-dehydrase [Spirochaetales bacterium]|nr:CDP-4-keto-6-deoxy-D-glucose-3-dehydrase [Spirochaetales bacterium]